MNIPITLGSEDSNEFGKLVKIYTSLPSKETINILPGTEIVDDFYVLAGEKSIDRQKFILFDRKSHFNFRLHSLKDDIDLDLEKGYSFFKNGDYRFEGISHSEFLENLYFSKMDFDWSKRIEIEDEEVDEFE